MITVIIPTYNRAGLLPKALQSVSQQSLACDELIVVDDGSTDATAELVHEFAETSSITVRYLYQGNSGASAARNLGIREASSDMLCFLDSDDWWDSNKLAYQYAAMEAAPEYLISHTRETWFRHGKRVNQKKKHAPPHGDIFARSLGMCVVGMSTVMVHRSLFDQYGCFDESLLCCEDYDLWLRVSRKEHFLLVDEPLTLKDGGRTDQLSAIHRLGMDTWRIRALCKLLKHNVLTERQYDLAHTELERKCRIYGNGCIKHGRTEQGQKYLDLPAQYNRVEQTADMSNQPVSKP